MCYSHVFGLGIVEILNRFQFWPSLGSPRGFSCVKNLYVDSVWIGDSDLYHVVLYLCILERLEISHSRVFGLAIFKIFNRCQFWPSLASSRVYLTRVKISTWTVHGLETVTSIM